MSSEAERIELLRAALATCSDPRQVLGIGDDAAVLEPGQGELVWSIDVQVEHVHFERDWLSNADLGYRATMAAASDLAAMGATPRGVLASVVVPPDVTDAELGHLAEGQALACRELGTALAGGNLAAGAELSVTTTVLGQADHPLTRAGAHEGDVVWLAGPVGRAAAGLAQLQRRLEPPRDDNNLRAALDAFRRPVARIQEGLQAAAWASAAIDVSDGLACDLARLVGAARERGRELQIVLDPAALVDDVLVASARELDTDALELALHGGEDYALAVTATVVQPPTGFVRIGSCRPAPPDAAAIVVQREGGVLEPVVPRGFDHFG